jgi:hypothetical protein
MMSERRLDDATRVYYRAIDCAFMQDFMIDDVVLHIKKDNHERFVRETG